MLTSQDMGLNSRQKLLIVRGKTFTAGAIFEKQGDNWIVVDMAPYLRKVIGSTPIKDIGTVLKSKGIDYEWF